MRKLKGTTLKCQWYPS